MAGWACPECGRAFSRRGQSHTCGTSDRIALLFGKPAPLVDLFEAVERAVSKITGAEIVYAEKYALVRGLRYAAHMQFMRRALRIGAQLENAAPSGVFTNVKRYGQRAIYFVDISTTAQLRPALPYVLQAVKAALR